jgi:hypothetical protein
MAQEGLAMAWLMLAVDLNIIHIMLVLHENAKVRSHGGFCRDFKGMPWKSGIA